DGVGGQAAVLLGLNRVGISLGFGVVAGEGEQGVADGVSGLLVGGAGKDDQALSCGVHRHHQAAAGAGLQSLAPGQAGALLDAANYATPASTTPTHPANVPRTLM